MSHFLFALDLEPKESWNFANQLSCHQPGSLDRERGSRVSEVARMSLGWLGEVHNNKKGARSLIFSLKMVICSDGWHHPNEVPDGPRVLGGPGAISECICRGNRFLFCLSSHGWALETAGQHPSFYSSALLWQGEARKEKKGMRGLNSQQLVRCPQLRSSFEAGDAGMCDVSTLWKQLFQVCECSCAACFPLCCRPAGLLLWQVSFVSLAIREICYLLIRSAIVKGLVGFCCCFCFFLRDLAVEVNCAQ